MAQLRNRKLSSRAKGMLTDASGAAAKGKGIWLKSDSRDDFDVADELVLHLLRPHRLTLLTNLANLRDKDAVEPFWKKWGSTIESSSEIDLLELRDQLREVWRDPSSARSEKLVNGWLKADTAKHLPSGSHFRCSIRKSMFLPYEASLRGMLVQGILEHWEHFKYCSNPDCVTPYFVAKRSDQTVCDAGICKAEKQREHARNWWNENRAKGAKQ